MVYCWFREPDDQSEALDGKSGGLQRFPWGFSENTGTALVGGIKFESWIVDIKLIVMALIPKKRPFLIEIFQRYLP